MNMDSFHDPSLLLETKRIAPPDASLRKRIEQIANDWSVIFAHNFECFVPLCICNCSYLRNSHGWRWCKNWNGSRPFIFLLLSRALVMIYFQIDSGEDISSGAKSASSYPISAIRCMPTNQQNKAGNTYQMIAAADHRQYVTELHFLVRPDDRKSTALPPTTTWFSTHVHQTVVLVEVLHGDYFYTIRTIYFTEKRAHQKQQFDTWKTKTNELVRNAPGYELCTHTSSHSWCTRY